MIYSNAVDQSVWPTRVFTYIPANGAGTLAARIGHIVETLWVKRITQVQIHQPWLHNCTQIGVINLKNTVHTGKYDHDTAVDGDCAAAEACACAPWHNRYFMARCNLDNLGYFFCRGWQYHYVGCTAINRSIVLIQHQVIRRRQYITCSKQGAQFTH